jgi:hypothetical protein
MIAQFRNFATMQSNNKNPNKNFVKLSLGFILVFLVRIIPFRPPNIEPILAFQMPAARTGGGTVGFLFGALSILLFDLSVNRFGIWTLITGAAYGLLGAGAALFFRHKTGNAKNYAIFAVLGTIFYDAVTGLSVGPIFFGQSFFGALVGQVPFTLMHLLGNVLFAVALSPALEKFFAEREGLKVINQFSYEK